MDHLDMYQLAYVVHVGKAENTNLKCRNFNLENAQTNNKQNNAMQYKHTYFSHDNTNRVSLPKTIDMHVKQNCYVHTYIHKISEWIFFLKRNLPKIIYNHIKQSRAISIRLQRTQNENKTLQTICDSR